MEDIKLVTKRITDPGESFERTQSLRTLLETIENSSVESIPESLLDFIETLETGDKVQCTLIGIILNMNRKTTDLGIFSRIFFGLYMDWEPAVQSRVRNIFKGESPKKIFEQITEMVAHQSGSETELYYAYNTISELDYDRISSEVL